MESIERAKEELRNVEELISGCGVKRGEYANKLAALEARRRQLMAMLEERRSEGEARKKVNKAGRDKVSGDASSSTDLAAATGEGGVKRTEESAGIDSGRAKEVQREEEELLSHRLLKLRAKCKEIRSILDEMEILIDSMCCLNVSLQAGRLEELSSSPAPEKAKEPGAGTGKGQILNEVLNSPEIQKLVGQLVAGFLK